MKKRVLIVEDEENLAKLMQDYLQVENIHTDIIADGTEVKKFLKTHEVDVMLLDLMLPGKDGISICKETRTYSQVPIIITTARVGEIDRIIGLEIGADDYVCKPYSPRELVARVKVQLRKSEKQSFQEGLILSEDLTLTKGAKKVELTVVEYKLFKKLYDAKGRIFNRDQLIDSIYNDGRIVSDRTIDSHIKKVRQKIKTIDPEQEHIHSIYGYGYKYETK